MPAGGRTKRRATHAGSWYEADPAQLGAQLEGWLRDVNEELREAGGETASSLPGSDFGRDFDPPVKDARAIIAPHAGYSYSGPAAAWAYRCIPAGSNSHTTSNSASAPASAGASAIKRVFILGPSHHVYLDGCALSTCESYATPLGDLPLDVELINGSGLAGTGEFEWMDVHTDEDEHSIEMHLPYIRKVFEG